MEAEARYAAVARRPAPQLGPDGEGARVSVQPDDRSTTTDAVAGFLAVTAIVAGLFSIV